MVRRYLFSSALVLALSIFIFSFLDNTFALSYNIPHFDSFEHLLGGVSIGFFALVLAELSKIRKRRLVFVLVFTLVAGVAWEIMEFFAGMTDSPFMSYPIDTLKDLILDMVGGYLALKIGHRMHIRYI
jgi:hypothetical protein